MSDLEYCNLEKTEWIDLGYIAAALSFMFSIMFLRFGESTTYGFFGIFINFFLFFAILFLLKQTIMKLVALRDGYELRVKQSFFNKFGLRPHDKLSYWSDLAQKNSISISKNLYNKVTNKNEHVFRPTPPMKVKGIPITIISLFLYVLTLGYFIYPDMWSYKTKKIPHRFISTQQRFEMESRFFLYNVEVSDYRLSKALITGFLFYFVFGYFLKLIFEGSSVFYPWFVFALYWIAFVTLIPIPSSEGFELWRKNIFGWFMVLSMLIVGMISLLIFDNSKFTFLALLFTGIIIFFMKVYKYAISDYPYGVKDSHIRK